MRMGMREARTAANPTGKEKTIFESGFPLEPGPDSDRSRG